MMNKSIDDFFIPDNEVKLQEELDYSRVGEYIRSVEAFSRSTYQSVYIIDYFRKNFLYVSPNPMFLCGLSPEQMMELGYDFYLKYVPGDEQQFLIDLNEAGFHFITQFQSMSVRTGTFLTTFTYLTVARRYSLIISSYHLY